MPNKTKMLDYGGFVHSLETPMSAQFAEYLRQIDLLVAAWRGAVEKWNQSRFSPDLLQRKKQAQRAFDDFAAGYQDKYTIKYVERDAAFLPVAKFFARYRPLRQPFSILHCNFDMPLHTVYAFENNADLAAINAAIGKTAPLRWWQNGPSNHPCYLFGEWIWELKPAEANASDKGLALLFETTTEKDRLQRDRLKHDLVGVKQCSTADEQFISEAVRAAVWRREGGKCGRCGGHQGIDFSITSPSLRGKTPTAQNVQLLCAKCRAKQG
jgi:hypothetical protein